MSSRIAVLSAAHGHAVGYCRHLQRHGAEVVLADPDGTTGPEGPRGRDLADQLGVEYQHTYADALAAGVDGAVVCTENARHRPVVDLALAHGVAVLCEKPLATTPADALAMCEAAERANVVLAVAHPVRHAPAYRRLVALIQSGALGEVLSIIATNNGMLPRDRAWFVQPELSGGGAMVDHLVHCADLVDGLFTSSPTQVRAVSNRILAQHPPTEVETGGLVTAVYPSGTVVTYDCSWSQPTGAPTWGGLTLDVVGTRGRVRIDPFGQHVPGYTDDAPAWLGFGPDLDALMISDFLTCLRTGQTPAAPARAGWRTVRLMAAALESDSRGGEVVPLAPDA